MSKCQKCNNTGMADSGGVQPWGEPILIECDCVMEEAKITSRKQFAEWFYEYTGCDQNDSRYVNMVEMYWTAWQASRAAIEIDLSNMHLLLCDQNDVVDELTKHNLKVKV